MTVQEFFKIIDAIRFDDSLDEQYPELRGMARALYPRMRSLYNIVSEMYGGEGLNEEHGNKKHKGPKTPNAAMAHGEWEKRKDFVGDGFKQKNVAHKNKSEKRVKKVTKDNYEEFIDEAVKQAIDKYINECK